jgi:aquaporin rerated protein, other eukaryote
MVPAQLLGSVAAGFMAECVWPGDVSRANNTLGNNASILQGLVMEMFFTAQLVTVVLHIPRGNKMDVIYVPVGVGLSLFAVMLVGKSSHRPRPAPKAAS